MLCLEDGNRAREIACDMTSGYHTSLVYRYLDTFPRPADIPEWPDVLPEPELEGLEAQIRAGHVCIGTPEEVVKAVRSFADAGADQLVFGMLSTTMPVEIAIEVIETFGTHIVPSYDRDPVHSTQRQRESWPATERAHEEHPGLPPFRI
jgi:alkanesulfonate monooxygenase SsuD/methylene tetrahydromethanopterin reductase-like flavin-dependent oxidoreductase (luciferase family)